MLAGRRSLKVVAGNKGEGGPFAPLVVVTRNIMGTKEFNQFRGKMISLHSQGVWDLCCPVDLAHTAAQPTCVGLLVQCLPCV